jgi:hypothetical protein
MGLTDVGCRALLHLLLAAICAAVIAAGTMRERRSRRLKRFRRLRRLWRVESALHRRPSDMQELHNFLFSSSIHEVTDKTIEAAGEPHYSCPHTTRRRGNARPGYPLGCDINLG